MKTDLCEKNGRRKLAGAALVAVAVAALFAGTGGAAPAEQGRRVVAIADIHGALDSFTAILREAGLVDDELNWTGGGTILVQTGDVTDRGPEVRAALDLLMKLQQQAAEQDGEVIVTLGNHEAMNLIDFLRDTSPDDPAGFVDEDSEQRRDDAYDEWMAARRRRAEMLDQPEPRFDRDVRRAWDDAHPLGYVERMQAFGPDGRYGRWLRDLPAVVRIDGTLFMHAGLNPKYGDTPIDELNERVRGELERFDRAKQTMVDAGLISLHADLVDVLEAANELGAHWNAVLEDTGERPPRDQRDLVLTVDWLLRYQSWELLAGDGLLWFRGLAQWPEDEYGEQVRTLFEEQDVERIFVGHTVQGEGDVRTRFDGAVILGDTGMLVPVYHGRPSAVEFADDRITAIYVGERHQLYPPARPRPSGAGIPPIAFDDQPEEEGDLALRPASGWLGPDGSPLPFDDDDALLEFLRSADVVAIEDLDTGKTMPRRVELERAGVRARAIFHVIDFTRERADVDGRFHALFRDSWRGQIAAYLLARELGLTNVPPTVRRRIGAEVGSLQLWLENDGLRTNGERARSLEHPPDLDAWLDQELTMNVFDALIFNDDRNPGNVLVDADWNLWMIDHTRAFQDSTEIRDPAKLARVDRRLWAALQALTPERLAELLGPHLERVQVSAIIVRRDAIVEHFLELAGRLGEDEVFTGRRRVPAPAA